MERNFSYEGLIISVSRECIIRVKTKKRTNERQNFFVLM